MFIRNQITETLDTLLEQRVKEWVFFRRYPVPKVITVNGKTRTEAWDVVTKEVKMEVIHVQQFIASPLV